MHIIHCQEFTSNETIRALTHRPLYHALQLVVEFVGTDKFSLCHRSTFVSDFNSGAAGWKQRHGATQTCWIDVVSNDHDLDQLDINQNDALHLAQNEASHQDSTKWWGLRNLVGSMQGAKRNRA